MASIRQTILEKFQKNLSLTDEEDASVIEDIVNSCSWQGYAVGKRLSRIHRYLQNEFFKTCLSFVVELAKNYEQDCYDGRNEWACKYAKMMFDGIRATEPDYAKFLEKFDEN